MAIRKTRMMRPRGRGTGRRGCTRPCAWSRANAERPRQSLERLDEQSGQTTLMDRVAVRYKAIKGDQVDLLRRFAPDGTITYVNDAYCQFYQLDPAEVVGMNFQDLLAPEQCHEIARAIFSLTPEDPYVLTEPSYIRRDGKMYWVEFLNQAIFNDAGRVIEYQSIGRDITRQKDAELKIQQAQAAMTRATRMATLAVVGGGIGHEINQPLNAIRILAGSGLYMAKTMDDLPRERIVQLLEDISSQVGRIDDIIQHLRDFLRVNQSRPYEQCDMNECVRSALVLLDNQLTAADVRVEVALAEDLPPVYGVRVRFEEVVLNLVANAMQALEERPGERRIVIRTWDEGGVHLSVADNGPGLPDEDRERLFEPFFTTKNTEKAMGLGLSIVREILSSCRAQLSVTNAEEGGAHFQIVFPRTINGVHHNGAAAERDG
ncbi:ATP-binding protein [Desulfobaculum sp. SPO524]|uniref:PAS domain-containing sensor histidine kinase n=1 Tax=Desulfobaculum sp. SPO524 TaxID=3378071 RepID=UPI003851F58B